MSFVNVCFTINDLFFLPCCVAIKSIIASKRQNYSIRFFVVYNNLSNKNINKIKKIVEKHKESVIFRQIKLSDFENLPIEPYSHYTYENYFRINIPHIFPDIDKMLYLDSDIVVNSDISELFNTDISSSYLACVYEKYQNSLRIIEGLKSIDTEYEVEKSYKYYNSGILLINCNKWREDQISSKLFDFAELNSSLIYLPDQDTINYVINKNIIYLDYAWNVQFNLESLDDFNENDIKIIHFVGPIKPWKTFSLNMYTLYFYKYISIGGFFYIGMQLFNNMCLFINDVIKVAKLLFQILKIRETDTLGFFYRNRVTKALLFLCNLNKRDFVAIFDPTKSQNEQIYQNYPLEYPYKIEKYNVRYVVNTSNEKNLKNYVYSFITANNLKVQIID